ncbi:MAG: hypothetical protein EAX90_02000 [Candidatus Heimdallarchaeota archaeon]|nr:hypothetical protein [Candidatus Heimdallarchaeota archaeon]
MMKINPLVESPAVNALRKGKGFSREELAAAKFPLADAKQAGLLVDLRRKSKYPENVESLKAFKEEYAKFLVEKEKLHLKSSKENKKARKDAEKRKADLELTKAERAKEIEAEKKRVQEELAKREAEELAAATEEELSEDELAELAELEEGELEAEVTPEEALEKLEEDLAGTLSETPEDESTPVTEGTTRVVKRVRKKPTTTTKGATEQAEKKD